MPGKNYGPIVSGYLDPTGRNWEDVIFQKGKAVLDKELNLGQDIDVGQAEAVLRRDLPSGWIANDILNNAAGSLPLFASSAASNVLVLQNVLKAHVNGWMFTIQHTGTINTNTLTLDAAPVGAGTTRTDLVILEVWRALISPAPSTVGKSASGRIWQQGNVKTDPGQDAALNYADDIFDATIATETTRRVQLQYRLRVISGVDIFSRPYGLDDTATVFAHTVPPSAGIPDGSATIFTYANQSSNGDAGLWIAGDGNPANALGTVDGYMYAIPLCALFRRNSTAFDSFTNLNGAGVSPTSGRPDGLFNDVFVVDDMADLRLAVSPTGWNYQEVLDKTLTYLLDNSLRSEWTTTIYGGGAAGHTLLLSNQIGVSTANGGAPPYSGDATGGGPRVAQFDNVCRSFSGRAIYEVMTVAVPAPGGAWTNGATATIVPSALAVAPYSSTSFNWSSFAPSDVQFADVVRAYWIGTPSGKKTYDALNPTVTVAGTTNNGGLVEIQTSYPTSLATNSRVVISGVTGTTEANGAWAVTVIDSTHFTLQGSVFVNAYISGGAVAYSSSIASIEGLGTQPVGTVTITCGSNISQLGLTDETLYVDILVAYPPGSGLSATPTDDFSATQQTFMVNIPADLPDASPIWFDQTLLTAYGSFAFFNATTGPTPLASLNWPHREARLTYTTSLVNSIVLNIEADSETALATSFVMPERVSSIVSVVKNPGVVLLTTTLDTSGRIVTITGGGSTSPGDTLTVTYIAIRPFPQTIPLTTTANQVTVFFDTRAPQTARAAILGTSQQVIPKFVSKELYSLTSGVASPDDGYPFPMAYVQTGGIYISGLGFTEYQLSGEALISTSTFNATTGMLALPVYVNYSPNPDEVTLLRAPTDLDSEGRTFFKQTQASVYIPNAYAQDLSDARSHKNFLAVIAELAADSTLGFAGQLVLVLFTRWANYDETNGVFFDTNLTNNTTAASIFRLRTNMLNKRA